MVESGIGSAMPQDLKGTIPDECPVCKGEGGYFGEKECFVEVGAAWKNCDEAKCRAAGECKSTERAWAMCPFCSGTGKYNPKTLEGGIVWLVKRKRRRATKRRR